MWQERDNVGRLQRKVDAARRHKLQKQSIKVMTIAIDCFVTNAMGTQIEISAQPDLGGVLGLDGQRRAIEVVHDNDGRLCHVVDV